MPGISLTVSMRSTLLSLQNVASQTGVIQNRLATGLKVTNAIDNPSSYYTASALNNRASDLEALLDSMALGVQTIKAASEGIESGIVLLEQAKALANQSLEKLHFSGGGDVPGGVTVAARVTNEAELRQALADTSGADGVIVIENNIVLSAGIDLKEGQKLVGKNYADGSGGRATLTFNYDASATDASGIAMAENSLLSDLIIDYSIAVKKSENFSPVLNNGHSGVELRNLDISLHSSDTSFSYNVGAIRNTNGGEIELKGTINISTAGGGAILHGIYGDNASNSLIKQGIDSVLNIKTVGDNSVGLHRGNHHLAGSVNIDSKGHSIMEGNNVLSGKFKLATSSGSIFYGGTSVMSGTFDVTATGGWSNIFGNGTSSLLSTMRLKATEISSNARLLSGHTLNWEPGAMIGLKNTANGADNLWKTSSAGSGKATGSDLSVSPFNWAKVTDSSEKKAFEDIFLAAAINVLAFAAPAADVVSDKNSQAAATEYNLILQQYDNLLADSSYKGINLLTAQNLKVIFNENRSSVIEIKGVDAQSKGLGLHRAEWKTLADVEKSVSELEKAVSSLRSIASEFGNFYSIVSNREEFTENLINVLTEGADKLTLADMNAESANMLALQTSQQLAVNSLSLASQAAQSVLKLF